MALTPQERAYLGLGSTLSKGTILGPELGAAGTAAGLASNIQRGGFSGDVGAAADLAKLGTQGWGKAGSALTNMGFDPGTASNINMGATGALDALSVIQGLQRGGVQGYGQALGGGLQGAGLLLNNPAMSMAGGYVLAPLAVYNAIKNWQSGNTGSDALQGAEAGAAIGSIVPGLGTLVGALIGGGVGALSSAFGGGRADPETGQFNAFAQQYNKLTPDQQAQMVSQNMISPQQAMTNLAGIMDAKNNTPGHSEAIEQVFGRMGEQNMMNQMGQEINKAVASGQINPNESIQQQWTQTIDPWLESKGVTWNPQQRTSKGTLETPAMQSSIQSLMSAYENQGWSPQQGTTFSGWGSTQQAQPSATNAATQAFWKGNPQAAARMAPASQPISMNYNPTPPSQPMMAQAPEYGLHAEGGHMKKRSGLEHLERGAERYARKHLDDVYRDNFSRQRYDDGGGVDYVGNYDPESGTTSMPSLGATYAPEPPPEIPALTPQDIASGRGGLSDTGAASELAALTKDMPSGEGESSSSGHTVKGDLQKALQNLTGQNGLAAMFKSLGALAPIAGLAGIGRPKTNLNPPTAAPGMTQGATAPRAPIFNRTQNMAPSNLPGGGPMSLQDWYTYGQRPEASFFSNNAIPMAQMTGVQPTPPTTPAPTPTGGRPIPPGRAKGGSALDTLGGSFGMPEFDSAVQHHAMGPGDGTSDNIPAQLSDGEYVMDANTVSLLGNGSNKAGAAKLDQLRENLRRQAARPMSKGKQFMKAKAPAAYMGKGRK